jgi:hypothetical protein
MDQSSELCWLSIRDNCGIMAEGNHKVLRWVSTCRADSEPHTRQDVYAQVHQSKDKLGITFTVYNGLK